ncbi:TIGR01777 family oxidoreductase [Parabacteroides sp. FAFU027]|uniref:TIGR01777 family oxidoreductase n=1 Tax=Parabacteroides sp. FAFU027 TaxID=2922715 RepID=UPI001FAEB0F9|nr:TIGR01777 family oxidoreductase [Parabacteroides sp. FAFU027]
MKIVISGGSGLIGNHLNYEFTRQGNEVINLDRSLYQPERSERLAQVLADCQVVINLAGATINHPWTPKYKQEIYNSRILTTRALVSAINSLDSKPKLLISASAVGAYPPDVNCDESFTEYGTDFLATVCRDWEAEARRVSPEVRLAITRFGVVLAAEGGALPEMIRPYKYMLGGKIGNGSQGFPWVHVEDLVGALVFIVENKELSGLINITSPERVTNDEFNRVLSHVLKRPALLSVPKWALFLALGERANMLTSGQMVYPGKLFQYDYAFRYQSLKLALRHLCSQMKVL